VITSTIVVTDLTRTRVFLPGHDYLTLTRANRTALIRVRSGRIDDRQSVLVRYRYKTADKARFNTHQVDLRLQQDFTSGWSVYYAGHMQAQDVSTSGTVTLDTNNLNRHRLGLTRRRPRWSAGGEIEFNDDAVDPYNALHGNFDWVFLRGYPAQLDLRISGSQFWFRRFERRRASLLDVAVDYRRVVSSRTELVASAAYRFEHDSIGGFTHGIDVSAGVEHRIGLLTISCDVEYDRLRIATVDEDGATVWFRVRRDIPNLLGG